ncbi:HlyD family efflux transporter periplasmic adaptor subunit [Vulcanococcus sp.]|jgi:HlyD family secretion protein|uniref:HlyD family efflux transporter periplasmic adaptor subunit n=1 Tax=Vulcanococcus sp. TaxID=2856995 RepID=UPI0037DA1D05
MNGPDPSTRLLRFYERGFAWLRSPGRRRSRAGAQPDPTIIPVQVDLVGEPPAALPFGSGNINGSASAEGLPQPQSALARSDWNFRETVLLRPKRRSASLLIWTAVGGSVAVVIWALVAPLSETVAVQGKLEPGNKVRDVEAPVPGVVEAVLVKEGEPVRKGEPLLRFDLRDARSKLTAAQAVRERLINENRIFNASLGEPSATAGLTANQRLQLSTRSRELQSREEAARQELRKAQTRLTGLRSSLNTARVIEQRYASLERSGAVSDLQLLELRNKVQEYSTQVGETEREIARLQAALINTTATTGVDLRTRIEENLKRISELDAEIRQARLQLQYSQLKAPSDGVVFDISVGPSSVVQQAAAKPLMKVVPQDGLQARVYLPNNAVGFVRVGQKADLSIDTFNASDYGRIPATVKSVGSDALTPEELTRVLGSQASGLYFPAVLQLGSQQLRLQNRSVPLQAGMSLTADIVLRQRRFINIFTGFFEDQRRFLERLR